MGEHHDPRDELIPVDRAALAGISKRITAAVPQVVYVFVFAQLEFTMAIVNRHHGLDLDRLLRSNDMDFWHDVGGILRHVDMRTGELDGMFSPSCAREP